MMKKEKINSILILIAFIFNILIFAPLEIYFTNKSEFWFSINEFLLLILIMAFIFFLVIWLIMSKLSRKRTIFTYILFSLFLGLYLQGNFLNFGYGFLDGTEVDWNSMIGKAIINTLIWLIIMIIPFIFIKLKKEEKFIKFSNIISIGIILVETITLITLVVTQEETRDNLGLDNKNIFNLSENENVIVFMADTFEATYMNKILEQYPKYKEKLEDFTYFNNCTSVSTFTYSSLPTLFTGVECQVGNTLEENLEYCFENTNLYDILEEYNYSAEIYTEDALIPNNNKIKNLNKDANRSNDIITEWKVTLNMYKYSLYRYLPHIFKSNFYLTKNDFNEIKTEDYSLRYKSKTYYLDDVEFNNVLVNEGIVANYKKNSFKFYHLNGNHQPFNTTKDIEYNNTIKYLKKSEDERIYTEALATVNILCNYIDELKKSNIYNQTTIILLADHGYANRFYTTLLVKKANDNHEFNISSAPVSLKDDLIPTILNIVTNTKDYGKDIFDYNEGEVRSRQASDYIYESYFYTGNNHTVLGKVIFQTEGHAKDGNGYYIVDEQYSNKNKELTEKYNFKNTINLNQISNSKYVNLIGFNIDDSVYHIDFGANYGKFAKLIINRKETNTNVIAKFNIEKIYGTSQTINFKINNTQIYSIKLDSSSVPKEISFEIPKEIWNENDKITIEIELPDIEKENEVYVDLMAIKLSSIEFTN